jgi:hypothetical protein
MKHQFNNFRKNNQGVSVVIGALMLTLIVVTAATSFAIFTAQETEDRLEREAQQYLINSEKLVINHIIPSYKTNEQLEFLNISITNNWNHQSKIKKISINDQIWYNGTQYKNNDSNFTLIPFENEYFLINLTQTYPTNIIRLNNPLTIEINTLLTNNFEKTFYPPNPIGTMEYYAFWIKPNTYKDALLLDASFSGTDTENGYIVKYNWTVKNNSYIDYFEGSKTILTPSVTENITAIDLTVTDNLGMMATTRIFP